MIQGKRKPEWRYCVRTSRRIRLNDYMQKQMQPITDLIHRFAKMEDLKNVIHSFSISL